MGALAQAADEQAMQKHIAPPDAEDDVMTQYVRAPQLQVTNSEPTAEEKAIIERYGNLIALWVQKFKIYPEEAKSKELSGETVVRIRIDRGGNVRYYVLERSTGYPVLDRAAIDMIRRANPVPAVPNDYPAGEQFEFLVPVEFKAQ
jgi:protein TonB